MLKWRNNEKIISFNLVTCLLDNWKGSNQLEVTDLIKQIKSSNQKRETQFPRANVRLEANVKKQLFKEGP